MKNTMTMTRQQHIGQIQIQWCYILSSFVMRVRHRRCTGLNS